MIKVSVTDFRKNIFSFLEKVEDGETIIIQRNRKDVARVSAPVEGDWRARMKTRAEILVPAEKLIEPMEDIWEGYL